MARHLILMDAFKGSISSKDAAEAVASGIKTHDPSAIIDFSPVADGGRVRSTFILRSDMS